MASIAASPSRPTLPPQPRVVFVTLSAALLGQFSAGLGAQMVSTALVDIQGTLCVSADEASWIPTAYAMGEILMIPLAGMLIQAFGLRRFMIALCTGFMATALASTLVHSLALEIALRAFQGLFGGGFGVAAFGMTFRVFGGRNLPFGLTLLTFVQTVPASLGAVLAGWLTSVDGGWTTIYWVEIGLTAVVLVEVLLSVEQQCFDKCPLLRTDWPGYALLASGLILLILALSQGARRFWFDNAMIAWSLGAGAGLIVAFVAFELRRGNGIVDFGLLRRRSFGSAVLLNVVFRFGLLMSGYLAPQFLAQFHAYRPLETMAVLGVAAIVQLVSFPATHWLIRRVAPRVPLALGLVLFAAGAWLTSSNTTLTSAQQFYLAQALLGAAPALFIVPLLVIGTRDVKPTEGQSASTFFNGSRSIGQLLGTAVLATLIRHREQFHSAILTERMAAATGQMSSRLAALRGAFAPLVADDGRASAAATASLAGQVRQQAFVLAYNDVFLFSALVLAIGAALTLLLPPTPPTGRPPA